MAICVAVWLITLALLALFADPGKPASSAWWERHVDRGRATDRGIAEFNAHLAALRDGRPVS